MLLVREIERNQNPLSGRAPRVDEAFVRHSVDRGVIADGQGRMRFAQLQQFVGQVQDRLWIGLLDRDVACLVVRREWEPGRDALRREAGVRRRVPLHRRALRVAAHADAGNAQAPGSCSWSGGISTFCMPSSSP